MANALNASSVKWANAGTVFVLELALGKWYVGYSYKRTPEECMAAYIKDKSIPWLNVYPPVRVAHTLPGGKNTAHSLTLAMMRDWGWCEVRGSCYRDITIDKPEELRREGRACE